MDFLMELIIQTLNSKPTYYLLWYVYKHRQGIPKANSNGFLKEFLMGLLTQTLNPKPIFHSLSYVYKHKQGDSYSKS